IQPEWILTIIKQETAGVVRPRFEQHWLSKLEAKKASDDLKELRYRSMSFGLGQIMGFNYKRVGAASAKALYIAPLEDQITFVARFLAATPALRAAVAKKNPNANDFKVVARRYNGAAYAVNEYDEKIARKFREFVKIRRG
ncbi:MAG: N-acetylmuramidase domain-containing protein, partial [Bacteroidota bacterium]